MRKQEQLGSEMKSIHSNDDEKQLSGFFLLLFTVSQRTKKKDIEVLKKQVSPESNK
jgi:hypothetical protein